MARIRLTNKTRIANDPSDMEGNRQDCGKKTRKDKYTNFDPAKDDVGGRGKAETDGSKLYEGDKGLRNEMHVTQLRLKQAKMWERSKLATKLAMYLLGEKAPQSMIKAQAAEFLSLGNSKLAKAVSRWAKTEYLYADQQEEAPKAKQEAEKKKQEAPAKQAQNNEVQTCGDLTAGEECTGKEDCTCKKCAAPQDVVQEESKKTEQEEALAPQDVVQEEAPAQADDKQIDEATLASIFENNSNTLVANKAEAKSSKVGVQKFEQPQRVASKKVSLDQLWEGAPDLSNVF